MIIKSFIPELDLWIHNILSNNSVSNNNQINNPVKVSDKWRCKDSVIELLFNETAQPSGKLYDNQFHFIYNYKTVNKDRLYDFDKAFYNRIQIYPNSYIWCANDPHNEDFQNIQNLTIPTISSESDNYIYKIMPNKYVTKYKGEIITTTNDELYRLLPDENYEEDDKETSVYGPDTNVFGLTKEELELCEYLYYYRTGQFELIHCFPKDFYYSLRSPLSKWIYLYIQCYLFNTINYELLNTITTSEDGTLRCIFEKYAQERIYQYVQKQHCVIYNEIKDIGAKRLRRVFEDYTMPCHTFISRRKITEQNINCSMINIDVQNQENQPIDRSSFEFIYDGKLLKNGTDYTLDNIGNKKTIKCVVNLINKDIFKVGVRYHMMWSCLILTTPKSRIKGFQDE